MKFLSLILCLIAGVSLNAMDAISKLRQPHNSVKYTCRKALLSDLPCLINLLQLASPEDRKNIVLLPLIGTPSIREKALASSIAQERIFIATNESNEIIGYKKLFLIANKNELFEILRDEIRCLEENGSYKKPLDIGRLCLHSLTSVSIDKNEDIEFPSLQDTFFIYNGADFTHPAYREKGINSGITCFGLKQLFTQLPKTNKPLCLVYGLIDKGQSLTAGRTPGIAALLNQELQLFLSGKIESGTSFLCARFKAFKPEFDQATGELLPDKYAVPGFGHLLISQHERNV